MSTSTDHITWDDVKKLVFSLAEQSKETDRRMEETALQMQETDRVPEGFTPRHWR